MADFLSVPSAKVIIHSDTAWELERLLSVMYQAASEKGRRKVKFWIEFQD